MFVGKKEKGEKLSFSDLLQKKFGPTEEVEPELQPSGWLIRKVHPKV